MDNPPELLPDWAFMKSDGQYMVIGAQLPTRDGRWHGNGVVVELLTASESLCKVPTAVVYTDAGNRIQYTEEELASGYYPPKFIMKFEHMMEKIKEQVDLKEKYLDPDVPVIFELSPETPDKNARDIATALKKLGIKGVIITQGVLTITPVKPGESLLIQTDDRMSDKEYDYLKLALAASNIDYRILPPGVVISKYSAITGEQVKAAMIAADIVEVEHHRCNICQHMVRYVRKGTSLYFDSCCPCSNLDLGLEARSFDSAADWINMQPTVEKRAKIAALFGLEDR